MEMVSVKQGNKLNQDTRAIYFGGFKRLTCYS